MIFDDNSKVILSNLHKNICCGCSLELLGFIKTYVVGAHWNCLGKAILMSTHNIGFYEEISKSIP